MSPLSRIQSWLLILYLGTAPVRWLPGVDFDLITRGKVILFVVAVGSVFVGTYPGRLRFPAGLAGPLGFAAIATLSIPGLIQSQETEALAYLADLASGATMLWCFYNVVRVAGIDETVVLERSAVLVGGFAWVAFLAAAAGSSDWQAPCAVAPLAATGFGCGRTGWSQGIAPYLAILMVFLFRRDAGFLRRIGFAALGMGIVASQLGVGGRAGFLASVVVASTMAFFFMPRRWKTLAATAVLLLVAAATVPQAVSEHLRFHRIADSVSFADVDRFSGGRVSGALEAVGYVAAKPVTGHGFGGVHVEFRGDRLEIHNLWLKWAAYAGIGAPAVFLALSISLLYVARRLVRSRESKRSVAAAAGLVLVSGLVISMLASGTPLGAFQDSAIWWAAAGIISAMAANLPKRATSRANGGGWSPVGLGTGTLAR